MPHPTTAHLNWYQAELLGAVLFALAMGLSRSSGRWPGRIRPYLRESAIVAALYGLWQLAGMLAQHGSAGAFERARWIAEAEAFIRLPPERDLQRPLIEHPLLGQLSNLYYAVMHLSSIGLLLFWLFWRHRDRYAPVRTLLAIFTGLALLIQLIPVAPPRLLPELGNHDIAALYGQSVYSIAGFSANELEAMPSVHIGWAAIVAGAVIWAGTGRWRWLILIHPLLMLYVVTATGNHWWFDSLGALLLLAPLVAAFALLRRGSTSLAGIKSSLSFTSVPNAQSSSPRSESRPS